jgi:hypothetical protein
MPSPLVPTESVVNILLNQTASLATVVTAIVAYFIYKKSKDDELENAVRIIILEIKESERIIKRLNEEKNSGKQNYSNDLVKVTPLKGWGKYSHLFIKKLNNDEYDQLNEYFKQCEVLEKYIEKNHNFFWVSTEERARQNEAIGAQLILSKPDISPQQFSAEFEHLTSTYFGNATTYTPAGIKTQLDRSLDSIVLISISPVWNKLKSIAKMQ